MDRKPLQMLGSLSPPHIYLTADHRLYITEPSRALIPGTRQYLPCVVSKCVKTQDATFGQTLHLATTRLSTTAAGRAQCLRSVVDVERPPCVAILLLGTAELRWYVAPETTMSNFISTYVEGPRAFTVTPQDHSGIAIIVTTLLMVWTILCFLIRLYTRISQHISLGVDDAVCGVATVRRYISLIDAEHLKNVNTDAAHRSWQRCSLSITPRKDQLYACYALMAVVAGSGVAAIIANCVRCNGDRPWDLEKQHCGNYVGPPESSLIVVSIVHLKYIYTWRSSKYPFVAAVDVFVQLQVEAHFATMAATLPALGTFVKSLNTRWGALDARALDASYAMHSYPVGSHNISDAASRNQSVAQKAANPIPSDTNDYRWRTRESDMRTTNKESDETDRMIIRKTVDMCVEHDE
nr:hypothetical protein CFP56_56019 [Quercus suber]